MVCSKCQHENTGGKFCGKCGNSLLADVTNEVAATSVPTHSAQQPNVHVENAKKVTKMYFGYFMNILKSPYSQSKSIGTEHFINGLITVALYALFIPLMVYLGLKDTIGIFHDSPFFTFVVKPSFGYAVFIMLVASYSFAAIKLGKVQVSYQAVIARFGSLLVPFVGMFGLALLFAVLEIKFFVLILFIGFIGSIFTVPALTISSFKKDTSSGLDVVYGTILTYVATFITLGIMANILLEAIKNALEQWFGSFFF
ncbi:zinc ribbon domain-containing protein [Bacillus sp. NEB1478]|uniref:zinc ribbon domain-containing protein n=1 Tax=Bacillus sp. NEB1478 TaxID=3073816 RepID=UPI0028731B0C|nr:zinc ribbon domain-containing protein [Bacillus sp. NEB1478]WNB92521.1 zinc ribbon domain-containing protein [Bacillus sp. NEB1478]